MNQYMMNAGHITISSSTMHGLHYSCGSHCSWGHWSSLWYCHHLWVAWYMDRVTTCCRASHLHNLSDTIMTYSSRHRSIHGSHRAWRQQSWCTNLAIHHETAVTESYYNLHEWYTLSVHGWSMMITCIVIVMSYHSRYVGLHRPEHVDDALLIILEWYTDGNHHDRWIAWFKRCYAIATDDGSWWSCSIKDCIICYRIIMRQGSHHVSDMLWIVRIISIICMYWLHNLCDV